MSDTINEVPDTTPDFITEAANQLADMFPEVVADGKIDIEKLKTILGVDVDGARERFGLAWPGKAQAIRAAQTPTTATLMPDKENSVDWDVTQNIFIEGDNLEVLKILQKHYYGQIKVIYIDPPYNTGKDFVYSDNYTDPIGTYLDITGQRDGEGKLSTNTESAGRFHSNWLNMMYPRLKLARNLLTDDGVILVSIDDSEAAHLRQLLDEIFGEANFIANICHKSRGSVSNDKIISPSHNTIFVYARRFGAIYSNRKSIGLDPDLSGFDSEDERGAYKLVPVDGPGGARKGNPFYEFLGVKGYFRYSLETMQALHEAGEIVKRGNTLQRKYYLEKARRSRKTDTTWWDSVGYTSSATSALKSLMGGAYFDSPKPVGLIDRILRQFSEADARILDFFAGSGTTAHAVMQLNAEDGGNRQCISVQLPEPTGEKSEARKAGYVTISEISRARIRLAGEKIFEDDSAKLDGRAETLDVGFRAYKLVDTNFTKWKGDSGLTEEELADLFTELADSADDQARPEMLLTEVLLKLGFSLTEKIETVEVAGLSVFSVADGLVIAYLDEHIQPTLDQLRALVGKEPERLVVLEDAFQGNDELKTNLVQECRTRNVDLWTA
ncbi:site-specific DNA-methyltransferase [Corynebacterium sp. CCM 9186]|uniref:site-specific DNA-methyltransferase n=1 Tax=Corynebacterium meridianum TaxID=2765363 RepID=UPI0020052304|nr:site-specific DNA-methyltransferase [Corynebacterium meridianum]MCK7677285.1 site-specific DNA-methyltransferase [Corynebacterium meridianum]